MAKPADENWKGIPHFRVRADVTSSNAWRVLSYSGKALYADLRAKLRMGSNGNVNATLSEMKHVGWVSAATLSKALYELQAVGLIVKTRGGGVERGSKVCSLYGFTDLDINQIPKLNIEKRRPSYEYRNFKSTAEARSALQTGVAKLRDEGIARKGKVRAQKKIDASIIEQVKPVIDSEIEQERCFTYSKTEQDKRYANAA